jgi:hypothetical protein
MTALFRTATGALLLAMSVGQTAVATVGTGTGPGPGTASGPTPTTMSSHRDTYEVWRVHPSKKAAWAATMTLKISDVEDGDRGAMMVVEDRHIPATRFDPSGVYGFAYAELGNDHYYPQVYDNPDGISSPECPVSDNCAGLEGREIQERPMTLTFGKVINGSTGKPFPYAFHDFYVGAVNAHLTVIPKDDGWTVSRATNAEMVLVQNSDNQKSVGARVENYSVEQFNGDIYVKTPDAVWSEAFAGLPCGTDIDPAYPLAQTTATFTGFTIPDGEKSMTLKCKGRHFEEAMASGPTTWRVTTQPTGSPANATAITPTQNLNRLVVLIVDRGTPRKRLIVPKKGPL